jgi:ABC-type dipeptide/oligopeptide/nickel transport system permease component
VLLLVSSVVFAIMHILPGDPVQLMLAGAESGAGSPEALERVRQSLGLDDPLYVQYTRYLFNAMQGDLGTSIRFNTPVTDLVVDAARHTFILSIAGLIVALLIGVPLGIIAALYEDTWVDTLCMVIALFAVSMPLFWLGQLLILGISIRLGWLPAISGTQPTGLILPALTMGAIAAGLISRLTRSTLSEVLRDDYIRTARAKGLSGTSVVFKHGLRNAVVPVVALAAVQLGYLLGGSIVIETIFALDGLGYLAYQSITHKDFPVTQAVLLLLALIYVLLTLAADLLNAFLDPRIRVA